MERTRNQNLVISLHQPAMMYGSYFPQKCLIIILEYCNGIFRLQKLIAACKAFTHAAVKLFLKKDKKRKKKYIYIYIYICFNKENIMFCVLHKVY